MDGDFLDNLSHKKEELFSLPLPLQNSTSDVTFPPDTPPNTVRKQTADWFCK
jgi:hypothetical protein